MIGQITRPLKIFITDKLGINREAGSYKLGQIFITFCLANLLGFSSGIELYRSKRYYFRHDISMELCAYGWQPIYLRAFTKELLRELLP